MTDPSNATDGLGPRPARLNHDPTTQLSAARAGVLDALSVCLEPSTVQHLALTLNQHANTVREHLDSLVQLGLAQRIAGVANGRGRPPIRYRAVPPESVRPQIREYATLASVLAAQLLQVSPDPEGDAIAAGMAWGRQLAAQGPPGDADARARAVEVLSSLGFDPVEQPDGSVDLQQCPLLETARANSQIICKVHLGMLRALHREHGAPADDVTLEPFAKPGACVVRFPADDAHRVQATQHDENEPPHPRTAPD